MTKKENIIFGIFLFFAVGVVTMGVVCTIGEVREYKGSSSGTSLIEHVTLSQDDGTDKEQKSMIETYAAVINAFAVLGSLVCVIVASFRKSRRDKIDDLKIEMQVRLTHDWNSQTFHTAETEKKFFESLSPKFKRKRYEVLHQCAFDELIYESRNEALRLIRLKREAVDEKEKENLKSGMPGPDGIRYR